MRRLLLACAAALAILPGTLDAQIFGALPGPRNVRVQPSLWSDGTSFARIQLATMDDHFGAVGTMVVNEDEIQASEFWTPMRVSAGTAALWLMPAIGYNNDDTYDRLHFTAIWDRLQFNYTARNVVHDPEVTHQFSAGFDTKALLGTRVILAPELLERDDEYDYVTNLRVWITGKDWIQVRFDHEMDRTLFMVFTHWGSGGWF